MAGEPRRSDRATKGQHKNASSSPAPGPKAATPATGKAAKGKPSKKSKEPELQEEDDEDEEIRCICGNTDPKDKRAFIGCDACTVWQHNVCMGIPEDEDEVPDHYFCELCRPEEHAETIQAIEQGEKIWETRNKIYQNEKKMSKNRKSKNRGEDMKPAWLKKDVLPESTEPDPAPEPAAPPAQVISTKDAGNKRKRESIKEESEEQQQPPPAEDKSTRSGRQDKRRKPSAVDSKSGQDVDTALVNISDLPKERQNVAQALRKIITSGIQQRVRSGYKTPDGETPDLLGEHYATRLEYSLHINHVSGQSGYKQQFMALNANLKKNHVLIERLLDGSLSTDELSTMSSSDMASEELQRERASMKEALDRQAIALEPEGPKYKQDHKGFHLIEGTSQQSAPDPVPAGTRPSLGARESSGGQAQDGSPAPPLKVDTGRKADAPSERRSSSQHQFDMNKIWATTAHSPTAANAPRPLQMAARRQSSAQAAPTQQNGTKDDADIDRMLEDNDESYSPTEITGSDAIVWRGQLAQSSEDDAPTVNARFVAGRDLAATVSWQNLLPDKLSIDGRLQIKKAEEYLCGLRWSSSSDVSVLALSPYDNAEAFNHVFNYFHSRERYAVVEKDKPPMVKDLYIIPVEAGTKLPEHIQMLEHCTIKAPAEERLLLATLIVARAPESPPAPADGTPSQQPSNGHLPQHMRQSIGGPAGSPLNNQNPTFSPSNNATPQAGYGASSAFPPNPYAPPPAGQPPAAYPQPSPYAPLPNQPAPPRHSNPMINEVLGELQFTPTAQTIFESLPDKGMNMQREQLENLRTILVEDPEARTNFHALTARLYGPQGS